MADGLTSKTLRGLNWSYFGTIVSAGLQIGFTAILARLLNPAAFGLVAMAGIILRFGSYFAQMGVGSALIQKGELTSQDIRAAFTSSALLGIIFWALTYLLAPLALYIFDSPQVVPVIRAMGLSFVFNGFSTTALSLLRRRLDFRSQAIIDISSYVVGYGLIGLLLAFAGLGVWSLVIASLSQAGLVVLLAYLFVRHSLSLSFYWGTHRRLISFGGRISVISFLEFIGVNVDTLVIGRVWGPSSLGIYTRSFAIANLPVQYLATAIPKVLFPSLSQLQNEPTRLRTAYYTGQMLIALVTLPLSLAIIPAARELVLTLLGSQWVSGVGILQILSLSLPFNMATVLPGVLCDSTGRLGEKFFLQLSFVCLIAFLIAVTYSFGLQMVASAVVAANGIRFIGYQILMRRIVSISYGEIWRAHVPGLLVSIGVVVGVGSVHLGLQHLPIEALLFVEIVVGGLIFFFLVLGKPPDLLKEILRQTLTKLESGGVTTRFERRLVTWYLGNVLCKRQDGSQVSQ